MTTGFGLATMGVGSGGQGAMPFFAIFRPFLLFFGLFSVALSPP